MCLTELSRWSIECGRSVPDIHFDIDCSLLQKRPSFAIVRRRKGCLHARGDRMKISELAKRTQVSKETIHYYVPTKGCSRRPRKLGRNVAEYNESYVQRIRLIKEFQDHRFLPLSLIKRILKYEKDSAGNVNLSLNLETDYFRPVDQLLPTNVVGEKAFRKTTGLGRKCLANLEEWEIVTPELRDGRKTYSQDDVSLGKVVMDMDRIGYQARGTVSTRRH